MCSEKINKSCLDIFIYFIFVPIQMASPTHHVNQLLNVKCPTQSLRLPNGLGRGKSTLWKICLTAMKLFAKRKQLEEEDQ